MRMLFQGVRDVPDITPTLDTKSVARMGHPQPGSDHCSLTTGTEGDKLREECGVVAIHGHADAARMAYLGLLDVWIDARPATREWWGRVQTLPSFIASIPDKVPAADFDAMKTFGGAIRARVAERLAEYRRLPKAAA